MLFFKIATASSALDTSVMLMLSMLTFTLSTSTTGAGVGATVLFSLATDTVDSALLPKGTANTANAMAAAMINFFFIISFLLSIMLWILFLPLFSLPPPAILSTLFLPIFSFFSHFPCAKKACPSAPLKTGITDMLFSAFLFIFLIGVLFQFFQSFLEFLRTHGRIGTDHVTLEEIS